MSAAATGQPDAILKDLAKLWVSLAKDKEGDPAEQTATGSGVLRAIAMTLIAAVDESEDPAEVGETVALLMKEHPSRAITLRLVAGEGRVLSSRVYAQCWMPFGQRRQICCEQIEITASECAVEDLPAVVLPLTVPDLPVILWCRSARMVSLPEFAGIEAVATKIIVDGDSFASTGAAFEQLQKARREGRVVADLAWTRITRWREITSRAFEDQMLYRQFSGPVDATIEYESEEPHDGAYYYAAWLADGIESCGGKPVVTMRQGSGAGAAAGLCSVSIRAASGAQIHLKADAGAVEVNANGKSSRTIYPNTSDSALLQEELSLPGRDPVFEAALQRAVEMSKR